MRMYSKLVTKLDKIFNKDRLEKFFYGPYFPIYIALFVTLFFVMETAILGLFLVSITASIIFLRFKDATPIIPLLFFVVLIFRDYDVMGGFLPYLALAPAIISFILKFFIYPVKNFKPGKLFVPLILVCYALFLGGLFSPLGDYLNGIPVMVTIGPVMLVIYLFFSAYICPPKNYDIKKYICFVLTILGLTATAHLAFYRLNMDVYKNNSFVLWFLGWGNVNCAATLILLAVPSCWYLITQTKNIGLFFILLGFLYCGAILSNSAGVTAICLIFTPILAFFGYKKTSIYHRKAYIITILTITLILIIIAVYFAISYSFNELIITLKPFFSDSSRSKLYKKALSLFSEFPLFGVGLGYIGSNFGDHTGILVYNFHSVLFHVMATMGIMGIVAYVFYYIARFKILMKSDSHSSLFLTIAFIMFECYAFIDTSEFNAIPLMSTLTVLITVVEITNKKSNGNPLPLTLDFHNKIIY